MLKKSIMSGKLKGLHALNTSPLNNPFCQKMHKVKGSICEECYSIEMLTTFRSNCNPCYIRNGNILSSCILPEVILPFFNDAFFRFSAHGELINDNHFINLLNICKKNPHCTFSLWTKRRDIINRVFGKGYKKPKNLILVYSEPAVNHIHKKIPRHFDKIFIVLDHDSSLINCENRCISCLKCYKRGGDNVIIERKK